MRTLSNENTPLAVGSAFKLGVLAAVDDLVRSNVISWTDTVKLEKRNKSLPSGILQSWPEGTSLTVESLAALMISISDNTATDHLLGLAGREKVAQYMPQTRTALSTAELFKLKDPANADLLNAFRAGTYEMVLAQLKDRPLPDVGIFSGDPIAIDIEWYLSAVELAALIERLESLDVMTINPGLADKAKYRRVAFKGGSESGVFNLTTWLADENGETFTIVVTVNDDLAPLDENTIIQSYQELLANLR